MPSGHHDGETTRPNERRARSAAHVGAKHRLRAVAFDLKAFFAVTGKDPVEVSAADVFEFLADQRGDRTVARLADRNALTGREREVLALIGQGNTNTEIAARLFVSEGTVKTHINHLFTKLQLHDRAAAIVFAFEHHLVPPLPDRGSPQSRPGQ